MCHASVWAAEEKLADNDVDMWQQKGNYASFEQYQEGAEAILEQERRAGLLDRAETEHELEAAHGPITYSLIGVIAKEKSGRLKQRLIHDL